MRRFAGIAPAPCYRRTDRSCCTGTSSCVAFARRRQTRERDHEFRGAAQVRRRSGRLGRPLSGRLVAAIEAGRPGAQRGRVPRSTASPSASSQRRSRLRPSPRTSTGPCSAARFSKTFENLGRFRCGLYGQRGHPGLVLRIVPATIRTLEQLNLPPVLREIALVRRGSDHRDRPFGLGQDGHALGLGRPVERVDLRQDRHHRGSGRGDLPPQEGPRRPARGRHRRRLDRGGHRAGDRPGCRRDRGRRSPRRRVGPRWPCSRPETGHQVFATMFNPNSTQVLERLIGMVPSEEKRL